MRVDSGYRLVRDAGFGFRVIGGQWDDPRRPGLSTRERGQVPIPEPREAGGAMRLEGSSCRIMVGVFLLVVVTRSRSEHRQRRSAVGLPHRSGIGTEQIGCRGFTGPVPPPLLMSALSSHHAGSDL